MNGGIDEEIDASERKGLRIVRGARYAMYYHVLKTVKSELSE